jgi:hypothetical protein
MSVSELQKPEVASPLLQEQQELQLLSGDFEKFTQPQEVVDDQFFVRRQYSLDDGHIKIVFRGREELPVLDAVEGVTQVLSLEEKPKYTSGDDFGEWAAILTEGDPYGDVFERASRNEESDQVNLIASATPMGLVDCAIKLTEAGIGGGSSEELNGLKKDLANGTVTDEVIQLYDSIIAATLISKEGSLNRPIPEGSVINEDGLMQVVLAMCGEEAALQIVQTKSQLLAGYDAATLSDAKVRAGRGPEDADMKQPGERLSADELEIVRSHGFVAVHTSAVMPYHIAENGEGVSVIRSTAEFGGDGELQFPRSTVHFSLNHAVESHVQGSFDNRPVTVVAPLEKILELNGAPAVLHGVDTYTSSNPGEGVFVPEQSTIIHTTESSNGSFIEQSGNVIEIHANKIDHSALQEYAALIKELGGNAEPFMIASQLVGTDVFSPYIWDQDVLRGVAAKEDDVESYKEYLDQAREFMSFVKTHVSSEDPQPTERQRAVEDSIVEFIKTPGLVDEYPSTHSLLVEAMRRTLVNTLIVQKYGGRVVRSDGMSAYIEDDEFSHAVEETAKAIGVRTGLHQYQSESSLEHASEEALRKAESKVAVPRELSKRGLEAADFKWEKYDSSMIWSLLSAASPQTRRTAVKLATLTYAHREEPYEDSGLLF